MAGELLRLTVRCDELAPSAAREAIATLSDLGAVIGDVMLVASELVTNAVRHSLCSPDDFLTISLKRDGWLRVSVVDPGRSGLSAEIANRAFEFGGLGLKVVNGLADRWGTERQANGYEVWADLPLPR